MVTTGSPPRLEALRQLLADEATPLSVVFFAGVAAAGYDPQLAAMDAEALIAEIESNTDRQLSELCGSKLIAGQTVYYTDLIYRNLPAFVEFANLVDAEEAPTPNLFNPASVTECALALLEIAVIDQNLTNELIQQLTTKPSRRAKPKSSNREPEPFRNLFDTEILKYWGAILVSEGAAWPIAPLIHAIVPEAELVDDPLTFETIDTRTKDFKVILANTVWQRAYEIFEGLKRIPTLDGKPLIKAAEMSAMVTRLVGPAPQ